MATKSLGGDGNWNTAGNWGGALPVDDDVALIPQSLNANVTDTGDQGAIDLDNLQVHKDFGGLFGTSGSPIHIGADVLKVYGSSGFYFNLDDDGAVDTQVERAWINCQAAGTPVQLGKHGAARAGSDYLNIFVNRGNVTFTNTVAWAAAAIIKCNGSGARCTFSASGPTVPSLIVNAGQVWSNVVLTTLIMGGGIAIQDLAAITTAHIGKGATLDIRYGGAGVTVATLIYVGNGGTLIMDNSEHEKTVTTAYAEPGAIIRRIPDLHPFTTFYDQRAA